MSACLVVAAVVAVSPAKAQFELDGDLSVRYVDTSRSDGRTQYRFRAEPQVDMSNGISVHAFVASGTGYSSVYNTIDEDDDEFHFRRLFLRLRNQHGFLEFGTIPTYKGRVSSTGLSENGWIKGLRGVLRRDWGAFEVVLGELGNRQAQRALSPAQEVNYIEFEYTRSLNLEWSYEISAEHMLDDNFLRGELRYVSPEATDYSLEAIHNFDTKASKFVIGMERTISIVARPIDWYVYYAYADQSFGPRAELTEDFLDFGHALANEFSAGIGDFDRFSWFAKAELYENRLRGEVGVEFAF